MDTVKPIPHTMHTLAKDFQLAPAGKDTHLRRIANHEKENTPKNLPTTKPNITAKLTPEKSVKKPVANSPKLGTTLVLTRYT